MHMMHRLGWLCAVVPITTVIICTIWSMQAGLAPRCFPPLEGCLSISAACRSAPVIYLFRATMLPMAAILIGFWWQHSREIATHLSDRPSLFNTIRLLSISGSAFLALYVLFLGTEGPVYEFLRRVGIYVFFGGTGIAQLLTTFSMRRIIKANSGLLTLPRAWHVQRIIVLSMLMSGVLNLALKELLDDSRRIENIIEWNFALVMFLWYALQAQSHHEQLTCTTRD